MIQIEAFLLVKAVDYCCIIYDISKPNAIHLIENSVSDDHGYIKCIYKKINIKKKSLWILFWQFNENKPKNQKIET